MKVWAMTEIYEGIVTNQRVLTTREKAEKAFNEFVEAAGGVTGSPEETYSITETSMYFCDCPAESEIEANLVEMDGETPEASDCESYASSWYDGRELAALEIPNPADVDFFMNLFADHNIGFDYRVNKSTGANVLVVFKDNLKEEE